MRTLVATVVGFAASLGFSLANTACSAQCDCEPRGETPVETTVPLESARRYTDGGNTAIAPLNFTEGSITTEGEFLTVRYVNPEGEYTVTYEKQDGFDY